MHFLLRKALQGLLCLVLAACGGDDPPMGTASAPTLAPAVVMDDRVVFSANRSGYTIIRNGDGYSVVDGSGADGTTAIAPGIGHLRFADVTVNLGVAPSAQGLAAGQLKRLIELYIAFFNRVPEADGLAYWIERHRAGEGIEQIADAFYSAAVLYPDMTGYTKEMTAADFVRVIYRNVLGRTGATAPPEEDIRYWASQLASGGTTRGVLVRTMLDSAHTFTGHFVWGWVPALLNNKYVVGHYFAVQHGLNYNSNEESIQRTMEIAAAVTPQGFEQALQRIPVASNTPPVNAETPVPTQGGNPPVQQAFSASVTSAPPDGAVLSAPVRLEVQGSGLENVELLPAGSYTPIYGVFTISADKTHAWLDFDPATAPAGAVALRIVAWNVRARESGNQIAAMSTRTWTMQHIQPAVFSAELLQAPAAGATLDGIIRLEVRGSALENVELLPATGYSPRLGSFWISPDKTYASLQFDTRLVPNNLLRVRVSAFDVPPGASGSREIVVMPSRDWFLRNLPAPYGSPEGRAVRCLSSGQPHTALSDPWPVVCIGNFSMPYQQCKDESGRPGFGMIYDNPEDGLPLLRDGVFVAKLYCAAGANNGRLNPGCVCYP